MYARSWLSCLHVIRRGAVYSTSAYKGNPTSFYLRRGIAVHASFIIIGRRTVDRFNKTMKKLILFLSLSLWIMPCFAGLLSGMFSDLNITFYGVQTIYKDGTILSGCDPKVLRITGTILEPKVNGRQTIPLNNYPAFEEFAEQTMSDPTFDGGSFLVTNNGYVLIYYNEEKGYANYFYTTFPGNPNSFILRGHYSTDPSVAGNGESNANSSYGNPSNSNNYKSGSGNSSNSSRTCPSCRGARKCSTCNGKGSYYHETGYYTGKSTKTKTTCPVCSGTGNCGTCRGAGSIRY